MKSYGTGGRSGVAYPGTLEILRGILITDPPRQPKPGWNRRRWVSSPFGRIPVSGATLLMCGICGFPQMRCWCDFESYPAGANIEMLRHRRWFVRIKGVGNV